MLDAFAAAIADMDRQPVADPKKAAAVLSPSVGLPEPVVEIAVERQAWGVVPVDQAIAADQQKIADTFTKLGLIPKSIRISEALPGA